MIRTLLHPATRRVVAQAPIYSTSISTRHFSATSSTCLTAAEKDIVKATVPILETGGEALTTHFYHLLLDTYPQVRPFFNQAHQASGRQPRALAASVLAYAKHIDNLAPLKGAVERITNKHVALQILPEHYPLVGESLLRAIREVLGEKIATDKVIAAWGSAYGELADILIKKEEDIYHTLESTPGGWRSVRQFKVVDKIAETRLMTSFYFEPVDGKPVIQFTAGQYIGLKANIQGTEQRRNYSLSDTANGKQIRISVKREPGGKFSNYLHDNIKIGDIMDVFPPVGEFVLDTSRTENPLVLISAGAGITPTIPMLKDALKTGRKDITFIHCARAEDVHAFRPLVEQIAKEHKGQVKVHTVYETKDPNNVADATGMLTRQHLEEWISNAKESDAYFLGPKPFMKALKFYLRELGVPEERTFYEFFGPAEELEDSKETKEGN